MFIELRVYSVYNKLTLDWNEAKRKWTLQERGLDFSSVAEADWDRALTIEDSLSDYGEARFVSLVPIHDRLCVVAWCRRGDMMRVISLRKANARERAFMKKSEPYIEADGEVRELDTRFFVKAARGRPPMRESERKVRMNFMIEPDIAVALEKTENKSAFVNKALRKALS